MSFACVEPIFLAARSGSSRKRPAWRSIQIHPDLAEALKAGPSNGLNLIGDIYGRPIQRAALSHLMRLAIRAAGLPYRCVPHGIRKATLRTMAEHGASAKQLAAVSGHKTTKELDRYTAAADHRPWLVPALRGCRPDGEQKCLVVFESV